MENFVEFQNNEINHLKTVLDDLSNNLDLIEKIDKKYKINVTDKLRILNKKIYSLEILANEILYDISNNSSDLDNIQKQKILQIEKDNKLIYKLSPLILYYQFINQDP